MRAYFLLQYTMLNRRFREAGIAPLLAYLILLLGFVALSAYLFYKIGFAEYIYAFLALTLTGSLSETRRIDFLKLCFSNHTLRKIRVTENLLVVSPFVVFFICKSFFLLALLLIILTTLLAVMNFRTTFSITLPTPFYKRPFEFTVGFRNTFYVIGAAYVVMIIAMTVGNFNLGVFSMLLVFAVTLSYYARPEKEYYVWIFGMTSRSFLTAKIKTALIYSSWLALPIALMLGIAFQEYLHLILAFLIIGWAFLICMIVSKYAAYPDELNVIQTILLALCIAFPPLLLILIPYLFNKATNRLTTLLQ